MNRSLLSLRCATVADAPFLVLLWQDSLRRVDRQDQLADVEILVKSAAESPEQRVVIAEYDGVSAGALHLSVSTISPINLEPSVRATSPYVLPEYRRRGVGRTLMEAAVTFAEELGIQHVTTAASSGSRDGNRFMARLALGPQAVLRVAPTQVVRAKLTSQRPELARPGARSLGQVLAIRRSQRRHSTES